MDRIVSPSDNNIFLKIVIDLTNLSRDCLTNIGFEDFCEPTFILSGQLEVVVR